MAAVALVVDSAMMSIAFCCAVVCDTYSVPVNYDYDSTEDIHAPCILNCRYLSAILSIMYNITLTGRTLCQP